MGRIIISIFFFFILSPSFCQNFDNASKGTASGQFLKIISDPKISAMGDAGSAYLKDSYAIDLNPACLIDIEKQSLSFSHSAYVEDTSMQYFSYAKKLEEENSAWGFGVKYFNWGSIESTDESGAKLSNMRPYDVAISISFTTYISGFNSYKEDRFVFGGSGKFISSKITKSANSISADLGFLSPYMFDKKFRLSMSVNNLIGSLKYDKESFNLPMIIRLGGVVYLNENLLVTSDFISPSDSFLYFAIGSQIKFKIAKKSELFIRGGVNSKNISDFSGTKNISAGFGFRYYEYNFNYSFSPYGELGNIHRLSFSLNY